MNVELLSHKLQEFATQRNWDKYHTPKNLVMALAGEAGELLELFQWLTDEESQPNQLSSITRAKVEAELADVCLYLIRLADKLSINLEDVCHQKILVNEEKYPIHLSRNNAIKYNRRDE